MFQGVEQIIGSLGLPAQLAFIAWGAANGVKLYKEFKPAPPSTNGVIKIEALTPQAFAERMGLMDEHIREMLETLLNEIKANRIIMIENMKNSQTIMLLTIDKLLIENRAIIRQMLDEKGR